MILKKIIYKNGYKWNTSCIFAGIRLVRHISHSNKFFASIKYPSHSIRRSVGTNTIAVASTNNKIRFGRCSRALSYKYSANEIRNPELVQCEECSFRASALVPWTVRLFHEPQSHGRVSVHIHCCRDEYFSAIPFLHILRSPLLYIIPFIKTSLNAVLVWAYPSVSYLIPVQCLNYICSIYLYLNIISSNNS